MMHMYLAQLKKKDVEKIDQQHLFDLLKSSKNGLNQDEADKRLLLYGPNTLKKNSVNALNVLVRQLKNSLIYLLLLASLLSYWIGDYSDGTIIFIILIINTSLSFYQEYKSEKIIEKLAQFIDMQVQLRRGSDTGLYEQSTMVPGDIAIIHEGDIVPADMKLVETVNLQANESQLTGESSPVLKKQSELLFAGSVIEKGMAVGLVYATGEQTEYGTIASLSRETKKTTQYEQSLQNFSSFLIKIILFGLTFIFISKLILNNSTHHIIDLLLFIIATAVAVVPEVLPVITTVSLSSGALKLAKKHVVVKRLSSVEDLGKVNLLCTDKTGTITENKMIVHKIVSTNQDLFEHFAYASIIQLKGRKRRPQNSYDAAFLSYISENIKRQTKSFCILKELPFDPEDRRRRIILEDHSADKQYLISIGAPETLFGISVNHPEQYFEEIQTAGRQGFHTLGIAYKEIEYGDDYNILKDEYDLIFLGYVSFEDPLRSTAKSSIIRAKQLGVDIKVLTGDSKEVAHYIGIQIGLIDMNQKIYQGYELENMSEIEFKQAILSSNVFARVSPIQKYNIIKSLKDSYVVAYQGDGINDAPALKIADVAIAVNSATDIAKENADIVLLNKSLEIIINGIQNGRAIFVNINKYIKYTMISNFGNFIALSVLYLFSTNLPLLPIQILLTSLITDIPLILISSDTVEEADVMQPEKHEIKELLFFSLLLGIPTALFELFYFLLIRRLPQDILWTSLYAFFTFIALVVFFAIRNKQHFWKAKAPSASISVAFILGFLTSLAFIYIPPFQAWFSFRPLSFNALVTIIFLTGIYFFIIDMIKASYYKKIAHKEY